LLLLTSKMEALGLQRNKSLIFIVGAFVVITLWLLLFSGSASKAGTQTTTVVNKGQPYAPRPFASSKMEVVMKKLRNHEIKIRYWPWMWYETTHECTMGEDRVGDIGDGGKWICGMTNLLQVDDCVVYSLGSNGKHDFEDDILKYTPCEVHVFDMDDFSYVFFGTRARFHKSKIGDGTKGTDSIDGWMRKLGHDHIDVLKIDIEGSEYDAFESLSKMTPQPWIGQILIEVHLFHTNWTNIDQKARYNYIDMQLHFWDIIKNLGLVQFHREENPRPSGQGFEFAYGNNRPRPTFRHK